MVVAVVALVAALGGGAVAGVAITSLNKKEKRQVKKIAKKEGKRQARKEVGKQFPIDGSKIADGAVSGPKIAAGAVNGPKIADDSIDDSKLTQLGVIGDGFVSAPVDDQTDKGFSAARDAAPKIPLYEKGPLSIYGKCFESDAFESYALIAAETTAAGSILTADDTNDPAEAKSAQNPWLDGDPDFLEPGTDEGDRTVAHASKGAGSFRSDDVSRVSLTMLSPDGTAVEGRMSAGIGAGGVFGSDDSCVFSGFAVG